MDTLMLPTQDLHTLANLALGTSVFQLGFTDGMDTATLARTANFVVAAGHAHDSIMDPDTAGFASWVRMIHAQAVEHKVIGSSMPWETIASLWGPRAFGLCVLNLGALGDHPPLGALNTAFSIGRSVVVIDIEGMDLEQPVKDVAEQCGCVVFRTGRLHVARPAPPFAVPRAQVV